MSNESGNTCMNPVARMIPAANALTMTNKFRSGWRAGMERVRRGELTPMMLVTRMEKMAMSFRDNAPDLSVQELFSGSHSSESESARGVNREMRRKKMERSLRSELAIGC